MSVSYDHLCKGMPKVFLDYFTYCDGLKFEQRPNYAMLVQSFEAAFKELGFAYDDEFDWVSQKKMLIENQQQQA